MEFKKSHPLKSPNSAANNPSRATIESLLMSFSFLVQPREQNMGNVVYQHVIDFFQEPHFLNPFPAGWEAVHHKYAARATGSGDPSAGTVFQLQPTSLQEQ